MKKLNLLGQLQSKAIAIELQHKNYPPAIERMRLLGKEKNFSPFWRVGLAYLLIKAEQNPQAQKELNIASQDLSKMEASPAKNELLHKIQKLQSDLNGTK
ncbi:MAG TPA: hypothetical protein ENK86_01120 [Campylobacterales bacterium]|nr:hypothetical protein [Campylobacterales bacterium]